MNVRAGAAIALLALLGSATAASGAFHPAHGPDPAVSEWSEWPHRVACGLLPFDPVEASSSETGVERGATPPEKALRRFLNRGILDWVHTHGWRLLAESKDVAEFAAGKLSGNLETMLFERRGGAWKWQGYSSDCEPATLRRGRPAITWTLADGQHLTPDTTRVLVNLGPGECNDGMSQNDRVQKPEFREQNGALLMTLWLRPVSPGGHTCQGLIEPPFAVNLPEPLGQRRLMDGGTYPPGSGREDELEGF